MPTSSNLFRARYGALDDTLAAAVPTTLTPVLETLLAHRSVRQFLPEVLPADTLPTLIAAAQSAPTSSNLQLWSVVAVEEAERRQRLSILTGKQAHVANAPLFLAWLVDLSRLRRLGAKQGAQTEGGDYLDAFVAGVVDAALAAQNVVTAAESLGLGTVYIGALRNHPLQVRAELNLPDGAFAVFGLCIGRPDPQKPATVKPRLPQPAVLHREQYSAGQADERHDEYDALLRAFYTAQGMAPANWSEQTVARLRDAASLHGRDTLRAELAELGFELR